MNIEDLTLGQIRELTQTFGVVAATKADHPWQIGKNYFIRTVTMIDVGRLVRVTEHELVLEDAAWIADTGRFTQALEKVQFGEVELFPTGEVIIGRGSVIDAVQIPTLPKVQK